MKICRKIASFTSVIALSSCLLVTGVFGSMKAYVNSDNVNLRNSGTSSGNVLAQLSTDHEVQILGKTGDYFKVTYNGDSSAYIACEFVTIENASGTVKTDKAPVYAAPEQSATVLGNIPANEEIVLKVANGDFFEIDYNGKAAYISQTAVVSDFKNYIKKDETVKTEEPKNKEVAQPKQDDANSVVMYAIVSSSSGLNLRSSDAADAEVVKLLASGEVLDILESSAQWIKVKTKDGKEGYVSAEFVSVRVGVKPSQVIVTSKADEIIAYAKQFIGTPYVWGGTNLNSGVDCSGYLYSVFKKFGYTLNRTSRSMPSNGRFVERSQLQPADLVFFGNGGRGSIEHVGMYIGNGNFIHAASGRIMAVTISSLNEDYYSKNYIKACRILD